jgi:hypothetical protein
MNEMEIAKTIQEQLLSTVGQAVILSWGQTARQVLNSEQAEGLGIPNSLAALKFKVSGHHHKNHVIVSLNGLDYYDVYICNVRKNKMTVKNKMLNLDVSTFGTWIDEQIEKIPEYN